MCDYSIRVTAVLEYLRSASHLPKGVVTIAYFHCAIIITRQMQTASWGEPEHI